MGKLPLEKRVTVELQGFNELEDIESDFAVGQNQWYHLGVGATPILVFVSGDWDVHWNCGILTHGHLPGSRFFFRRLTLLVKSPSPSKENSGGGGGVG